MNNHCEHALTICTILNSLELSQNIHISHLHLQVLLESEKELELFRNSIISSEKAGISKHKFVIFTTSASVATKVKEKLSALKLVDLTRLQNVGRYQEKEAELQSVITEAVRRKFLTAWLSYAVAASGNKMLWQSPGSLWFARPDDVVRSNPVVETLWTYKGRSDVRAAPFFNSMDFFVATGAERSVHLLHEIVLHFDLVLAWESLDALSAYRLAENNARYGTTSHLFEPYDILHTELMGHDPKLLRNAVDDENPPRVLVVPTEGISATQAKKMLQAAELWFL